jgi:hypothetical protein
MLALTPDDEPRMTRAEAEAILEQYRHKPDGPFYSVSYTGEAMIEICRALNVLHPNRPRGPGPNVAALRRST